MKYTEIIIQTLLST